MSAIIPKVFISYSWAVSDKVLELAERLVNPGGVDVILDKWDLKEGQDKYVFMEQAVNNNEVTNVLIICDETYAKKANDRKGGVGDETVIISAEVYGKVGQEKFIPVIFENDENGTPFLPTYIKTRIYIDLSNETTYEEQYEKLLRNLHGKPEYRKPKLSQPPEWLNEEEVSLSSIRNIIKQLNGDNGKTSAKTDFLMRKASDEFSIALKSFGLPLNERVESELIIKKLDATKPLRDYYIDYIEILIGKDMAVGEISAEYFERLHNDIIDSTLDLTSMYPDNLEVYHYFIWESFICTVAVLLHYEKYGEINKLLRHTYFLKERHNGENACNFISFRHHFKLIEGVCKPNCENPNLHTLAGEITVKREKKPLITKDSIADADLILYQLSCAIGVDGWKWFPTLYCYRSRYSQQSIWSRLKSKRYCEKILPLFGVTSFVELKNMIEKCVYDREYGYQRSFDGAPNILNSIVLDEIATLN
ncbi:MAG: toll/interleukin-1 receptor domain-containing protein [Defluviitaleaceae bacterium]|nr:toll/interleukin-1 receptor domain-containing protein [Defluviitaleaceae bacterium]